MFVALLLAGCGGDEPGTPVDSNETKGEPSKNEPTVDSNEAKSPPSNVGPTEGEPFTIPGLEMEMLWCSPGTFEMGSPESEEYRELFGTDETQHTVTLTKGFWLGEHEVTQAQWQAVMGTNSSTYKGANLPVEKVSWEDATAFC